MNVKCYQSTADIRQVDKTNYLTFINEYEFVQLKESTSTEQLSIIIQCPNDETMEELNTVNYFYVEELMTYYYRTDVEFLAGKRVRFTMKHDLLMTYKDDIRQLTCVVSRQENRYNQYLNDPNYKVYNYRRVQTLEFPNGFDKTSSSYLLTIAGGGN